MENQNPSVRKRIGLPRRVSVSGRALQPVKETATEERGTERAAAPAEAPANQPNKSQMPDLPLPDYEILFPKKRHGVMGQTRWDHIIAEVNQRRMNKAASANSSGAEDSAAAGHDEVLRASSLPPAVTRQSTAEPLETSSEVIDQKVVKSPKKALLPRLPVLRRKSSSSKQDFLPPTVPDDDLSCSKLGVQPSKPVTPCQTVELDQSPVNQSFEKPLRASSKLLLSALENVKKRDSRFAKSQDFNSNERNARVVVSEPAQPKNTPPPTVPLLSDSHFTGEDKTHSGTQERPLVKPRLQIIPPKRSKKDSENKQSECASAITTTTSKEIVPKCDNQPSMLNHCLSVERRLDLKCSNDKAFEVDPFPSDQLLSPDPWQLPEPSVRGEMLMMEENPNSAKEETLLSDPLFSYTFSQNALTGTSEPNHAMEISTVATPTPSTVQKKRRAPLPPGTSSGLGNDNKVKSEKKTQENSTESELNVKSKDYVMASKDSAVANKEQQNAKDIDMTSHGMVTGSKTMFAETSSKQQALMPIEANSSKHISVSAEKHPQATLTESMSVVENVQKCGADVDAKPSHCLENENNVLKAAVDISEQQPHVESLPKAGTMLAVSLTDMDEPNYHANGMQTSSPSLTQHVETGFSLREEEDACETVLTPAIEARVAVKGMEAISKWKETNTDCIEVEAVEHVNNANVQMDKVFICDPFCDDKNLVSDPWGMPLQSTHDDSFLAVGSEPKPTRIEHASSTLDYFDSIFGSDIPTNEFSDHCSEKFTEQNKAVSVTDTETPIGEFPNFQSNLDAFSPENLSCVVENSETSSDLLKSKPEMISLETEAVVCIPSEEMMDTESTDTSLALLSQTVSVVQPEVTQPGEMCDDDVCVMPSHIETAKDPAEVTVLREEIQVIPEINSQRGTSTPVQIVPSENASGADTENRMIIFDPFSYGQHHDDSCSSVLREKDDDDASAHCVKNEMRAEEADWAPNEADRNSGKPDNSEVTFSPSPPPPPPPPRRVTLEIGPGVILPSPNDVPSKQQQEPLLNVNLSTNGRDETDTPQTIPPVSKSKENAHLWKADTSPLAIDTSASAKTLSSTDAFHRQQDELSMASSEKCLGENTDHVEEFKSSYNIKETQESLATTDAEIIERPFSADSAVVPTSLYLSSPAPTKYDQPWESNSYQSEIHVSKHQFSVISPNGAAGASWSKHDILDESALSPEVPAVTTPIINSHSMSNISLAEPDYYYSAMAVCDAQSNWPGAGYLDTIFEEDVHHFRDGNSPWGSEKISSSFSLPTSLPSILTPSTIEPSLGGTGWENASSTATLHSRSPVCARVSPLEVQPGVRNHHHSSMSELASASIRPHPVRPLSSTESQTPNSSTIAVSRDLKSISINDASQKVKVADSGPYTQLTQEELITLVVKQQAELSKKDEKIVELEEYIDNLLVRVIEEKPSILMALAGTKGPF
ncbi:uncharacterized protein rab11fip1a isoform X1 [Engraulis encrasicolus]|uniref:uncharacterized protein rab11fip1a isoform X1 n=1 Tax=Engraulis encrasicolus TaxID=184585 RepID=UPI002FD60753